MFDINAENPNPKCTTKGTSKELVKDQSDMSTPQLGAASGGSRCFPQKWEFFGGVVLAASMKDLETSLSHIESPFSIVTKQRNC